MRDAPRTHSTVGDATARVRQVLLGRPGATGPYLSVPTSGSTGAPRTVLLRGAALRASGEATAARLGGHGRWLLALPVSHVAGLQVIARSVLAGTEPVVLAAHDTFRPSTFAAATDQLARSTGAPARLYTSLVPTQLHRLLDTSAPDHTAGLAAARRFDAVLVGGAATPPTLLAAARAAGIAVVTTYGMSETAGGCVYDGVPLDGVRLRTRAGRVEISGPVLADGYADDPDATRAAFVTDADGLRWFRTSDLGELGTTAKGEVLRVLGRADDTLITGGVNVVPTAVEALLAGWDDIAEACVVGLPDAEWGTRLVAVVTLRAGHAPPDTDSTPGRPRGTGTGLRERVRRRVGGILGTPAAPRDVVVVDTLPTRGPGKVDRRAAAGLAAAHLGRETGPTR